MEAFIAWLIASPIGAALIGVAVDRAVSQLTEQIEFLRKDNASLRESIKRVDSNYAKLLKVNHETSGDEIDEAIDEALSDL